MFKLLLVPFLTASVAIVTPPVEGNITTVRSIETEKNSLAAPKIDGSLDDECWKNLPVNTDFIISTPTYGKQAVFKTEVKIIYDDNAIYIGAYCYDKEPQKIQRQLAARDAQGNADWFSIGFDTYNDNINGFRFQLSAANVQSDSRLSPGNNDLNWDAVWFSKSSLKADGWVAEIKIPYSALRFPKAADQTWGLQFARFVQRTNELSSWSPVNPQTNGVVNQWGEMAHLKDLNPPLRLSFIPYITGGFQREPVSINPKQMANRRILSGGMDINWGINESFTLNTTLVPDFGQVQSDTKVLNLGPFEQTFQERRPFFTEGTELFNRKVGVASPGQIFYSRRIGQTPTLYYDAPYLVGNNEELISNPSSTQLYNATKVSGRTKSGFGIGFLNSVTAPMNAVIKNKDDNSTRKELTEPLTNYNMFVLDQSLKNNSRIGFANTSVIREKSWRNANVSQFLFDLRDKTNTYSYSGFLNFSQVYDKATFIKPQFGGYADFIASKISGNWRYDFEQYLLTDKYDHNDLGVLFHNNEVSTFAGLKYFDFEPKHKLNNWDFYLSAQHTSLYKPFAYQDFSVNVGADFVFTNFWYCGFASYNKPTSYYDYYEARTEDVKYLRPANVYFNFYAGSDNRKAFYTDVNIGFAESPIPNDPYFEATITPNVRVKKVLTLSHSFNWNTDFKNFGFAGREADGSPVIGSRKLRSITNTFSANGYITPLMNITFRARHYWSRVSYLKYYSLDEAGIIRERVWNGNSSQSFNLWNIDFVYNWQFAPGSNLILTWKQNIAQGDRKVEDNYIDNIGKTFRTPQTNSVSLKLVYYLDYAQMKEWAAKSKQKKHLG
jgi:hypothetical protein